MKEQAGEFLFFFEMKRIECGKSILTDENIFSFVDLVFRFFLIFLVNFFGGVLIFLFKFVDAHFKCRHLAICKMNNENRHEILI